MTIRTAIVACGAMGVFLVNSRLLAQATAPAARRPMVSTDVYRLKHVADPQLSLDGNWVAYTVGTVDSAADKQHTNLWMTSWDGTQTVRLTFGKDGESSPRWSPDGRYLAFLSSRGDTAGEQLWLLDRRGGEAEKITALRHGIDAISWAPDGKRLALVVPVELDSAKRADSSGKQKPIVVDRYFFKQDGEGYLTTQRYRLVILDLATRKADTLATGDGDVAEPRWSPDGSRIAFIHTPVIEPGVGDASQLMVMASTHGAVARSLTPRTVTVGGAPSWTPDGTAIVYLQGDEPKWTAYQMNQLAMVPADGSRAPTIVTATLDRAVRSPVVTGDGHTALAIVSDDRSEYLARIQLANGTIERLDRERRTVEAISAPPGMASHVAMQVSASDRPSEVYAMDNGGLRQLSHQNDSLLASLALPQAEDLVSRGSDGVEVHSVVLRHAGAAVGTRLPAIIFIHGGPNSQSSYEFQLDRQMLAAHGYAVISPNYRGSNGRGQAFQRSIFADWGHLEVIDILGATDAAVRAGIADSNRLGIGGWSYGAISTDYTIASTTRFKAAVSGAGSALQLSIYGVDEYVTQYEQELGPPWKNPTLWLKLSYPFFHADQITTPTLFLGGDADHNVPLIGGEQMYQALRANGVPTELIVYPGQTHGLSRPSFIVDRYNRYVAWYDKYLKAARP